MKRLCDIVEQARQTGHEVVHHMSPFDIDDFHPLSHFGTYKAARDIGSQLHSSEAGKENWDNQPKYRDRFHYRARLVNKGNTHTMRDGQMGHDPHRVITLLHHDGIFSKEEYAQHSEKLLKMMSKHQSDSSLEAKQYAAKAIRNKGIHTLQYTNEVEHPGRKSYTITHPNQVKVLKKTKVSVRSNQVRDKENHPVPARKSSDIIFHSR